MIHFKEHSTSLAGLKLVERIPLLDDRGVFTRMWCADELRDLGWTDPVCQINHTITKRVGAVRGLHFQTHPHAEMKFISCLRGEVFDVVVDLRMGSPTFLKWHGEILSSKKNISLLVPKGFAHGFQVLSENSELLYLHSETYSKSHESGILADDPQIAIKWPLAISERSFRDEKHSLVSSQWKGLIL